MYIEMYIDYANCWHTQTSIDNILSQKEDETDNNK